jgi:hypothetical protein
MLAFIKRWVAGVKRLFASGEERYDTYRPREQLIYHYWNGAEMVKADPIRIYKKMSEVGTELSANIRISSSPSKGAPAAYDAMVRQIRTVFGLKPFDEGGLSDLDSCGLLDHFLIYCSMLKKNSSPSPTSSTSTEASKTSSAPPAPPTSSSSDSGSTASGPSTEGPASSPTEPPSPTEPSSPETITTPPSPTET